MVMDGMLASAMAPRSCALKTGAVRRKHLALDDEGDIGAVGAVRKAAKVASHVGRRHVDRVVVVVVTRDDDPAHHGDQAIRRVERLEIALLDELMPPPHLRVNKRGR